MKFFWRWNLAKANAAKNDGLLFHCSARFVQFQGIYLDCASSIFLSMKHFFQASLIRANSFQSQHENCDILDEAIQRYRDMIKQMLRHKNSNTHGYANEELFSTFQNNSFFTGFMEELSINLQGECEDKPHPAMLEECKPKYQIDCHSFLLIYKLIRFLFTWKYEYMNFQTN